MKLRTMVKKISEAVAVKIAVRDADFTCPCLTYQPKLPEAIKKIRKG
jgi:cyclic lactone autoinducer peptide